MNYSFEIKDLYKYFGDVHALDGINLKAEEGTIFGLLGPNGAGKTTIVRILSTLMKPDRGNVLVYGMNVVKNPQKIRETIGLAGQYVAVDEYLSGYENVFMVGRLYGLSRREAKIKTEELLTKLRLEDAANRPVKTYSGGMRRRLDLGSSLIGEPKILFLDEPTTGLDPATRLDLWQIIRELVNKGTSILLTTQYLEEADELANKIAVVDHGRVIAEGTSDELKDSLGSEVVEFQLNNKNDYNRALQTVEKFSKSQPGFDEQTMRLTVPVKNGSKDLMNIVQALSSAKLDVNALSLHRPSLDDVFLNLTGQKTKTDLKTNKKNKVS